MEYPDMRCLVYTYKYNKSGSKNKLCVTAYNSDKCRCDNCKQWKIMFNYLWYINNTEKSKEIGKTYYKNNREQVIERVSNYQKSENGKQKIRAIQKKYMQTEKGKEGGRRRANLRRANKKNNGYERYKEKEVLDLYGKNCYICNQPIDLNAPRKCGIPGWENGLHIEHVIDIALGGPDTLANVKPAHALCNLKKKPVEMV